MQITNSTNQWETAVPFSDSRSAWSAKPTIQSTSPELGASDSPFWKFTPTCVVPGSLHGLFNSELLWPLPAPCRELSLFGGFRNSWVSWSVWFPAGFWEINSICRKWPTSVVSICFDHCHFPLIRTQQHAAAQKPVDMILPTLSSAPLPWASPFIRSSGSCLRQLLAPCAITFLLWRPV